MTDAVHLIVTRLFLKNCTFHYTADERGDYKPYCDYTEEDWREFLTDKMDLFLNRTLASVQAQTNKNFEYLVLVDTSFPQYRFIKAELEKYSHLFKLKEVMFPWGDGYPDPGWERFAWPLQKLIKAHVQEKYPDCKWLLTQRLDSDDIISNDYVEAITNVAREQEEWIVFRNGYLFDSSTNETYSMTNMYSMHHVYCEPFGSGVTTVFNTETDIKTVYHRHHGKTGFGIRHGDVNIIGTRSHAKGYWIDTVGSKTNAQRTSAQSTKHFQHRVNREQKQDIDRRFI